MIGQPEIDELMSEYAEAMKREGTSVRAEELTWSLTAPKGVEPIPVRVSIRWPVAMMVPVVLWRVCDTN